MPAESLHSEAAARNAALTRLRDEHRALARVIEALETVTAQAAEHATEPDFALLASMLYYVDAFPEQVHHPREERHLFGLQRRREFDRLYHRIANLAPRKLKLALLDDAAR